MIQGKHANVADNSGAKTVQLIRLGGTRRRYERQRYHRSCSRTALPNSAVERIDKKPLSCVHKEYRRPDGTYIRSMTMLAF